MKPRIMKSHVNYKPAFKIHVQHKLGSHKKPHNTCGNHKSSTGKNVYKNHQFIANRMATVSSLINRIIIISKRKYLCCLLINRYKNTIRNPLIDINKLISFQN